MMTDMGLGKTIQTITTMWTLMKQGPYGGTPIVRKALVVCPGALVKNWEKEFRKWLGIERIAVYAVSPEKKVDEFIISPVYQVIVDSLFRVVVSCFQLNFRIHDASFVPGSDITLCCRS